MVLDAINNVHEADDLSGFEFRRELELWKQPLDEADVFPVKGLACVDPDEPAYARQARAILNVFMSVDKAPSPRLPDGQCRDQSHK